ncbi:MAG: hypothetical protein Q9201_000418 [Fulgogasparrea decipioides]
MTSHNLNPSQVQSDLPDNEADTPMPWPLNIFTLLIKRAKELKIMSDTVDEPLGTALAKCAENCQKLAYKSKEWEESVMETLKMLGEGPERAKFEREV